MGTLFLAEFPGKAPYANNEASAALAIELFSGDLPHLLKKPLGAEALVRAILGQASCTPSLVAAALDAVSGSKVRRELAAIILVRASKAEMAAGVREYLFLSHSPTAKHAIEGLTLAGELVGDPLRILLMRALSMHWQPEAREHALGVLHSLGVALPDPFQGSPLNEQAARALLHFALPTSEGDSFHTRLDPHPNHAFYLTSRRMMFRLELLGLDGVQVLGTSRNGFFFGLPIDKAPDPAVLVGDLDGPRSDDTTTLRLSELHRQTPFRLAPHDATAVRLCLFALPARLNAAVPVVARELDLTAEEAHAGVEAALCPAAPDLFDLELVTTDVDRMVAIRALKEHAELGTAQAKARLDEVPCIVQRNVSRGTLVELLGALTAKGLDAKVRPSVVVRRTRT